MSKELPDISGLKYGVFSIPQIRTIIFDLTNGMRDEEIVFVVNSIEKIGGCFFDIGASPIFDTSVELNVSVAPELESGALVTTRIRKGMYVRFWKENRNTSYFNWAEATPLEILSCRKKSKT